MNSLRCLQENHERYDISLYYKDQQQWKLACLQCQYDSTLPKDSFIPIKYLEQFNLESQSLLRSEGIQQQFYESKTNIKQWIEKFTSIIEEINQFILKLEKQMMDRIETIQTFNLNDLTYQSFQATITSREIIKDEILKKKNFLQTTDKYLKQAYNLLQDLIQKEGPKLNSFNKENLVYKKQENQIQQKPQQVKVVEQAKPPQQQKSTPQEFLIDYLSNLPQISGELMSPANNEKYVGEYKNGKYHGQGELKKDGYIYKGTFQNGLKHGKGQLRREKDDYLYEGEFFNGKKHGQGKETYTSYDIEKIGVSDSFFKTVKNPKKKCTIILEGCFENDKKNGYYLQEKISNQTSTKKYVQYENDEFVCELD